MLRRTNTIVVCSTKPADSSTGEPPTRTVLRKGGVCFHKLRASVPSPASRRRGGGRNSLHDLELVHPSPTVFGDIHIAHRVHCNAMCLVELAGLLADTAEARQQLSGFAVDDIDLRTVLIDDEHVGLLGVGREIDRHGRAAELLDLAVRRHGHGLPRQLDDPLEVTQLVVDLNARVVAVADIDEAVTADRHAMHGLHALRLPLAQEPALTVHHGDATIAVATLAVGNIDVAVVAI